MTVYEQPSATPNSGQEVEGPPCKYGKRETYMQTLESNCNYFPIKHHAKPSTQPDFGYTFL